MLVADSLHVMDYLDLLGAIPDGTVDMVLSDPPYNITNLEFEFELDLPVWWQAVKRILKPQGVVIITSAQPFTTDLIISNRTWFRYSLVWVKNTATGFLDAKKRPMKSHEDVLIFCKSGTLYNPQMDSGPAYKSYRKRKIDHYNAHSSNYGKQNNGERYPTSVLHFDVERYGIGHTLHPTQKPVALFEYLIRTYSAEGALIVDPFVGSGTTALAAKQSNRNYICGDISGEYIEIAKNRIAPEFGKPIERKREALPLSDLPMFRSE